MSNPIKQIVRLAADQSGAAAVVLGLTLTGILGIAGLGTEVATWYMSKEAMQGAADAAAFTAMTAKTAGASVAQMTTEARSIAASYNFTNGSSGVSVAVNDPPGSGSYAGKTNAVEVIISQTQTPLISSIFLSSGPTIEARSVAASITTGSGCVAALDKGNVVDVTDTGSVVLNLSGCSLYVNSDDSAALTMKGSATIDAGAAYVVGGVSIGGSAQLDTTKGTYTGVQPIGNPYSGVLVPTFSGCNQTNYSITGGSPTISASGTTPYVFCGGLSLGGNSSLTLGAGTYIIDQGTFSMGGNTTLTATSGTTIVLTSSTSANYATASISGGASLSITAPSSGALAGLAIFQDPSAPTSGSNKLDGGTTQNITGAIYFPNEPVEYVGGASTGGSQCTQLIAYQLTFKGNSTFNSSCSGVGTSTIGTSSNQIVE